MLQSLRISNYELIDHIDQEFYSGLNVITGETGTGKSMILSALSLLGGSRANDRVNKNPKEKCILEATFNSHKDLKGIFEENDLDWDDLLIIRREFNAQGRSRAFINDSPLNLDLLKAISTKLIEVHSQDQTNLINDTDYQLALLDKYAHLEDDLTDYQLQYSEFDILNAKITKRKAQFKKDKEEFDFIQYQYDELSNTNILEGEIQSLEREKELLSKEDEIRLALESGAYVLGEQDGNTIEQLYQLLNKYAPIQSISPWIEDMHRRLNELYTEVKDLQFEMESKKDILEMNPGRLVEVEDRLHTYYALENKFKVQGDKALLELMRTFQERLESIEHSDGDIQKMEEEKAKRLHQLFVKGEELSQVRKKHALSFSKSIEQKLKGLGIKHPRIVFQFTKLEGPSFYGLDDVQLLFSSNKDQGARKIEEVASGGEKSRLMLAVKSILGSKRRINSMVFDEIDTGISGEVAIKTGELMAELGLNNQLISITHLPQVASKGKHHFKVDKQVVNNRTNVTMRLLNDGERVEELAEMLGGKNISESARKTAVQLLN